MTWKKLAPRAGAAVFLLCLPVAMAQTAAPSPATAAPASVTTDQPPPPPPTPGSATHVMGFENAKHNSRGKLTVANGKLTFEKSSIDVSSISDVFAGSESRQVGGVPLTLAKMAAPFGTGRALSLFTHQKVDNITIEYADSNGGLHGAIFMLPNGKAEPLKRDLIAAGAHASIPVQKAPAKTDAADAKKEKK